MLRKIPKGKDESTKSVREDATSRKGHDHTYYYGNGGREASCAGESLIVEKRARGLEAGGEILTWGMRGRIV